MNYYPYWGLCPEGKEEPDEFIHVGKSHWATCSRHKVAWYVGYNLITTYERMDDQLVRELYGHTDRALIAADALKRLKTSYRPVEPIHSVGGTP